jgi:deoxyhypusine synthase
LQSFVAFFFLTKNVKKMQLRENSINRWENLFGPTNSMLIQDDHIYAVLNGLALDGSIEVC